MITDTSKGLMSKVVPSKIKLLITRLILRLLKMMMGMKRKRKL